MRIRFQAPAALTAVLVAMAAGCASTPSTTPPSAERPPGSECSATECGPAPGMPAQACPDGSTGGNTGRCIVQASGSCGWEIRDCPRPSGGATCVPTGCSGTVCAEAGNDIATTCEYRPEYACYRSAQCEPQADGKCGWTQTAELAACLANPPQE